MSSTKHLLVVLWILCTVRGRMFREWIIDSSLVNVNIIQIVIDKFTTNQRLENELKLINCNC